MQQPDNAIDVDLDFELPLSRAEHRMAEAKDMLTIFGIPWRMSGKSWLRITMPPGSLDLYLCPGSGSLRWQGGVIFSSQGLPLALKLAQAHR
jgi:hypothetical protein